MAKESMKLTSYYRIGKKYLCYGKKNMIKLNMQRLEEEKTAKGT